MRRRSRALAAVAGILAVSFVVGACGSNAAYDYVRDTNERTALRLPQGWTTYDEATVMGELTGAPQGDQPDPILWLVGIDGDPSASVAHVLNGSDLGTDYPQGIAMVQELSFYERDNQSMQSLRNYLFPIDQLIQNESNAVVVSYNDEVVDGNLRGLQMVVSFREAALANARAAAAQASGGAPSATSADKLQRALLGGGSSEILTPGFIEIDQRAMVDQTTHKLYLMILLCSSDCYQRNRASIEDTVNSWTVGQ